jgi:hypothetical protein
MSSLEGSLHRKMKEVTTRVGLDAYAIDDLPISRARLILQEEIMFEQWEVRMYCNKGLAQMDEARDLED